MLPFDRRPWAKTLASVVIAISLLAATVATYLLHSASELHIPEIMIILLSLLTILPPNVEIVFRKNQTSDDPGTLPVQQLHTP